MEPKKEAYEIINKMCSYAAFTDEDCCFTERETMYKNAKELSLILVNYVLNNLEPLCLSHLGTYSNPKIYHYNRVKKHIEDFEIIELLS